MITLKFHRAFNLVTASLVVAMAATALAKKPPIRIDDQIQHERAVAIMGVMANISPDVSSSDALPGTVIASPSRSNPDYYYHWVRDAALVMNTVIDLYEETQDPVLQQIYRKELESYVRLVDRHQKEVTLSGLGEPKYFVDGRGFDGPWGRPQNDGPALRAMTIMRWAKVVSSEQQGPTNFYYTVIKRDLEYVSHNWQARNFDLWEEVYGHHFYTRMVQKESLTRGAHYSDVLGDPKAALWYQAQADAIENSLQGFYDSGQKIIRVSLTHASKKPPRHLGVELADDELRSHVVKSSPLDTANILAFIHTSRQSSARFNDSYLLNTVVELQDAFMAEYSVNQRTPHLGTAFGRYPGDYYYGGNPWFLTTFAIAEHSYRLRSHLLNKEQIVIDEANQEYYQRMVAPLKIKLGKKAVFSKGSQVFTQIASNLLNFGDSLLERGFAHMNQKTGQMDEQIHRDSGYMESARDLTWSYASFLTATKARQESKKIQK